MEIHVVRRGDTLASVAAKYGVPVEVLAGLNGVSAEAVLAVGQTLVVRVPLETHVVEEGDTVYSVARRYGLSVVELYRNNYALGGSSALRPGQTLVLAFEGASLRAVGANGYAYPSVPLETLDAALPYLTYLTPFTYGISPTGALLPLGDAELLAAAGHYRTATLMHLSSLTESGQFSSERASAVLRSEELREQLLRAVVQNLRRRNFYGLDVDFEFIPPDDREAYAAFIAQLRERLNPLGYPVLVALAPKTRADQPGLLYEAHDYRLLGEAANAVLLMAYEWGYTYGPPMAVAPLPKVRAVLDYAVSEIEPSKIFLGAPLYGYDWTLPYEQGVTRAESISPQQALERAVQYGVEISFDEEARAPYFRYVGRSGRDHVVWFEDARSARERLLLVDEYGLQGVGYWELAREFPQNWAVLHALYDVETLL